MTGAARRQPPAYRRLQGFATAGEIAELRARLNTQPGLFTDWSRRGRLGPQYRVISGEEVSAHLPEIDRYGRERVQPAVEAFAGCAVRPFASLRRAVRVQHYRGPDEGFRWHFDGHSYAAVVTLENSNRGETQIISPGLSRLLRFLFYPLYAWPQAFSLMPREAIASGPGDLLVFRGRGALHRGVAVGPDGERLVLVYAYDEPWRRVNPLRDRIAQWFNY